MSDRKRLLNDLRVIDLRSELEKRNLDKSGVRGVLIKRLEKHLEEEGHDPATYRFDLNASENKSTPTKRTRRSESAAEADSEDAPSLEDMIVQDDGADEDQPEKDKDSPPPDDTESQEKMDLDEGEKVSRKRELKEDTEDSEATEAKKLCLEKEDDSKTENNIDAEDSINLDLGEDELLNEETENTVKSKKDEAGNEDTTETTGTETTAEESAAGTDGAATEDQQVKAEPTATSNDGDKKDDSQTDDKEKENDAEKRDGEGREGGARNLWVSGLSSDTRAKDLKQLCSKHGKVIGAKVVTNARTPGSRCYGYVTMASSQDADNCIKNLHRTELHGRMISVEKAKSESDSSSRRQAARSDRRASKDRKDDKEGETKDGEAKTKKEGNASGGDSHRSSRSREKSHRSDKDRPRRSTKSRERRRSPREVLSFSKIWRERDVARARERSRAMREEERRRRAAEEALRDRERRQRQEKHRLALEREKLRAEREKIEREKNELLRLERERHRLEREKLELERLELKRAQLRLEEERRKRGYEGATGYRKPASSPPPEPGYDRHKRPAPPLSSSRGQFEAPPPPRFEMGANYDRGADKRERERDYKREYPRHVTASNMKYPSNGNTNDDTRQPLPAGARPKEPSRSYESRDGRAYRPSPPSKAEPRWAASTRYPDTAPSSKSGGGGGGGGGDSWSAGEARYGGSTYDARYPPAYQPPPPGSTYPDRYAPQPREYRKY